MTVDYVDTFWKDLRYQATSAADWSKAYTPPFLQGKQPPFKDVTGDVFTKEEASKRVLCYMARMTADKITKALAEAGFAKVTFHWDPYYNRFGFECESLCHGQHQDDMLNVIYSTAMKMDVYGDIDDSLLGIAKTYQDAAERLTQDEYTVFGIDNPVPDLVDSEVSYQKYAEISEFCRLSGQSDALHAYKSAIPELYKLNSSRSDILDFIRVDVINKTTKKVKEGHFC